MSPSNRISHIASEQFKALDDHCQRWLDIANSTAPADRSKATRCINRHYQLADLEAPEIFWCQSTWQLVAMPVAIQIALNYPLIWSSIEQLIEQSESDLWRCLWLQVNAQLDPARYNRLARYTSGVGVTSQWTSLSRDFQGNSFAALINQCFKENTGAELRERFNQQFRNRINVAVNETLAADLFLTNWLAFGRLFKDGLLNIASIEKDKLQKDVRILNSHNRAPQVTWFGVVTMTRLPLWEFICRSFELPDPDDPYLQQCRERSIALAELAGAAAAYSFYHRYCFVCDRPTDTHRDEQGRAHNEDGAAVAFSDGYKIYCWQGTIVPAAVITSPDAILIKEIQSEPNAGVRRVMIERFGLERFLAESGAMVIHHDKYGVLYSTQMAHEEEDVVIVKVVNRTPEPDGSLRKYFLRVPPDITSGRAAVAWTFGMSEEEYEPDVES